MIVSTLALVCVVAVTTAAWTLARRDGSTRAAAALAALDVLLAAAGVAVELLG